MLLMLLSSSKSICNCKLRKLLSLASKHGYDLIPAHSALHVTDGDKPVGKVSVVVLEQLDGYHYIVDAMEDER